jgi:hypothetical protein
MPYQPGWLAVHNASDGTVMGLRKLNVTEALNVLPGTNAPPGEFLVGYWVYAIPQGGVELYPVLNSAQETVGAEVLWWSATYGYGRYYIDNPPALSLTATRVGNAVRLEWLGTAQLQSADEAKGSYTTLPEATSGYLYSGASPKFFRLIVQP